MVSTEQEWCRTGDKRGLDILLDDLMEDGDERRHG
jgi:hypothetical protein